MRFGRMNDYYVSINKATKMINIVEQIYAHEGFGKEKIVAWLEKEMEDIFRDALGES